MGAAAQELPIGRKPARVVALGNVLLGDDGFGPLVIERFRAEYESDADVEVIDLGTPGLDLTPYLLDATMIVLVDTVHAPGEPGTLHILTPENLLHRKTALRLSAHDPGIFESLRTLELMKRAPAEFLIVGAVPQTCRLGDALSPAILDASTGALQSIARLLLTRGYTCRHRTVPAKPNLWWLPVGRAKNPS